MATQWWMGYKPEALKKENKAIFDLDKPLSSNMVALVCSAVRPSFPALKLDHDKYEYEGKEGTKSIAENRTRRTESRTRGKGDTTDTRPPDDARGTHAR